MKKIKIKTDWDLKKLTSPGGEKGFAVLRAAAEKAAADFVKRWKNRTDFLLKPRRLLKALGEYESFMGRYGFHDRENYYLALQLDLDQSNAALKARTTLSRDRGRRLEEELRFFLHRVAKIPREKQKAFLEEPHLLPYRHFLERAFVEARHLLPEGEERVVNYMTTAAYERWVKMVEDLLSREAPSLTGEDGRRRATPFAAVIPLMTSVKGSVRRAAAAAFNEIVGKHANVAEAELNAVLETKKVNDLFRGFTRPDAARHLADDIDSEVVDVLIETVARRFSLARRFYALKAKLLGMKRLAYHERGLPYSRTETRYPFARGAALVFEVFSKLDPDLGRFLQIFLETGAMDVFPRRGKAGGAYCAGPGVNLPTRILLNYDGKLRDVLTLAHECGHGVHNELMRRHLNALTYGAPLTTAEVASTFMEGFVFERLARAAETGERLTLLLTALDEDVSTIFRQAAAYRFETDLHAAYRRDGYLSRQDIGRLFGERLGEYMGPAVSQSAGSENWWVHWRHFRTPFYVYSYAFGLLAAKALQRMVRANPAAIGKVKTFLEAGSSAAPRDLFTALGIDIRKARFWDNGLDEVEKRLEEAETLAKRLKRL